MKWGRRAGLGPVDCAWFEEGRLAACAYPRGEAALAELARRGRLISSITPHRASSASAAAPRG